MNGTGLPETSRDRISPRLTKPYGIYGRIRCQFSTSHENTRFFSNGISVIADAYTRTQGYLRPSPYSSYYDRLRLIGDVREVGNDMRKSIKQKHVEQTYQSSGFRL